MTLIKRLTLIIDDGAIETSSTRSSTRRRRRQRGGVAASASNLKTSPTGAKSATGIRPQRQ